MKRVLLAALGCLLLLPFAQAQKTFTPGNLVVLQTTGTGSKASSSVVLREFSTSGTAGKSDTIPSSGPTPFQSAAIYGGSEGFLTTSTDGKFLVMGGYATGTSFSDITATTASTAPRVVGIVYPSGFYLQIDTSKTFYSVNDIRGAVSDGTHFWASGASNATDGINFFGPGAKIAIGSNATPPKAYGLRIFNNRIYYSTQKAGPNNSGSQLGIFSLDSAMPTKGPAVASAPIINTGSSDIPEDFSFNPSGDICYIAINLNTAAGGIQKWVKSGGNWSKAYLLGTGKSNTGAYGLVVDYSGTNPVIYATTFDGGGNRIIKIVDNGSASSATITTIVAATTNVYYKGITFAPSASGTPLVNINISKDTASEAGKSVVTVTANTSAPVSGNQTVSVSVSGSGINSGDFALSGTTITIPDGATSGSVTFTVKDDILGEGNEVANLTIGSLSSGLAAGLRLSQHITIADNDGNNHPTIILNVAKTTNYIDGGVNSAPASPFKLSGVISDPTDPASTLGIDFIINDLETFAGKLSVKVSSNNAAIVGNSGLNLSGPDTFRNLRITPSGVGYADIKITVSDSTDSTVYVLKYAASAASNTPAKTFWHTGMSDGSDALTLDDNYYISADDELDVLNVYSRSASGLPLVSFDYTNLIGLNKADKPEVDAEAITASPKNSKQIFVIGSMSNGSDFLPRASRDRIFAATYNGTGANTTFSVNGYAALKSSILGWGDANGYNFTASAASGVDSKVDSGFAVEGMVFGPDSSTLYIGFRAPLVPNSSRTKAVIAPVKNFESWFNNGSPSGNPSFGSPIELDLGGRGIRDLIRLSNGTYIILAGNSGSDPVKGALYKWSGIPGEAAIPVNSSAVSNLNIEGAMEVHANGQLSLTSLQVITDKGADVLYNDNTEAKEFGDLIYRKFRSDMISSIDFTYPEINLQGNNITIIDGDNTPSVADNTDFGNVNPGSKVTRNFVIENKGNADLVVSSISFTANSAGDYSLVNAPSLPLNIAPGGSRILTVQFKPAAQGARNTTLNIESNDYDESIYNVALTGNGVCTGYTASVTVSPSPAVSGQADNTIYLGYGPQSVKLTAIVQFGFGPYTYQWSPGAGTDSFMNVSPTTTTDYSVFILNNYRCTSQIVKTTINVVDVRDGNKKIIICHNNHTQSVSVNAVADHLSHGDLLGDCDEKCNRDKKNDDKKGCNGNNNDDDDKGKKRSLSTSVDDVNNPVALKIYPNPASNELKLSLNLTSGQDIQVKVLDVNGREVLPMTTGNYAPGEQTIYLNTASLSEGVYIIQVSCNGSVQNIRITISR